MNIKQAIEQFRSEKNDPEKPAYFIYSLLQTAHPTVVEMIEYQAAQFILAGENWKEGMSNVMSTEEGKQAVNKKLDELLLKYKTPGHEKPTGTEEDDG
jgi:hypothetical protein